MSPAKRKQAFEAEFAELEQEGVHAPLFGSRVNDDARGGDVDVRLLIPPCKSNP